MSQENIEALRAAMEAFNRRDCQGFDALLDEAWEDLLWEFEEEFRDGEDWVLAVGRIRGRGRDSLVGIDARAGWVARFREGQLTNFRTYPDRAEALEAVGLSE
jgi:ketosteroid isomerase-like protein